MNHNYWVIEGVINSIREIIKHIPLPDGEYEKENIRLQEAKEWLYELAKNDFCKGENK